MIIKKPTFHLHRRGRPGGSFGLRTYIFQVCLFSPGLPRAPTVAVLDESLLKSIMLGAFLLLRNRFFWNWHEGKRNSHHSAPAGEDFLQSACFPPGKSLDVSSRNLFIWIILKSWCVKLEECFAFEYCSPQDLCWKTRKTLWSLHGGKTLQTFPCR